MPPAPRYAGIALRRDRTAAPVTRPAATSPSARSVIAGPDGVRYRPVIDVARLAWCAVAATGLVSTAVAVAAAARRLVVG